MRTFTLTLIPSLISAATPNFWWITDAHVDTWGDVSTPSDIKCAWMPTSQLISALDAMEKIEPDPAFLLFSGDFVHFPARNDSDLSQDVIVETIEKTTSQITKRFPGKMLYPTLGNHDNAPSNNWPTNVDDSNWLYTELGRIFSPYLPESAIATFSKTGWYSADVQGVDNLRIISLNSNYWSVDNTYLPWDTTDNIANAQWVFFEAELLRAQNDGVKVYVNMHHPPMGVFVDSVAGVDTDGIYPIHQQKYAMMNTRYQDVIIAHFVGHDHSDEVRLVNTCAMTEPNIDSSGINGCGGDPLAAVFVGQALTNCNNPSFRLWEYEKVSLQLTDYEQYSMIVTNDDISTAQWPSQYRWSETYTKMKDLSAPEWKSEFNRWLTNSTAFDEFTKRRGGNRKNENNTMFCDEVCRTWSICNFQYGSGHSEMLSCLYHAMVDAKK